MVYLKLTVCWLAPQGAFYHMKLYSSIQSALFILCIWFYKCVKWKTCSWLVSGQRAWSQITGLLVGYISCKVIPGHWFIKGQQVKKEITCCLTLSLSLYICISSLWLIQSVYWQHMMKFINPFALFYCVALKQFHIGIVHNKYTLQYSLCVHLFTKGASSLMCCCYVYVHSSCTFIPMSLFILDSNILSYVLTKCHSIVINPWKTKIHWNCV